MTISHINAAVNGVILLDSFFHAPVVLVQGSSGTWMSIDGEPLEVVIAKVEGVLKEADSSVDMHESKIRLGQQLLTHLKSYTDGSKESGMIIAEGERKLKPALEELNQLKQDLGMAKSDFMEMKFLCGLVKPTLADPLVAFRLNKSGDKLSFSSVPFPKSGPTSEKDASLTAKEKDDMAAIENVLREAFKDMGITPSIRIVKADAEGNFPTDMVSKKNLH